MSKLSENNLLTISLKTSIYYIFGNAWSMVKLIKKKKEKKKKEKCNQEGRFKWGSVQSYYNVVGEIKLILVAQKLWLVNTREAQP